MSNLATIVNNILADSGIDDINVVVTTGSYANPAWITSLAWTKITGAPLGDYLPLAGGTMTGQITWSASTAPISFQQGGNTGTYTQTTIYANQNNTSGSTANGIFIERGFIDNSLTEIRHFVIGARGASIQWKLAGDGYTTQYDTAEVKAYDDNRNFFVGTHSGNSSTLFRAYQASGDGYLELRTGANAIVTKLSGYTGTPNYTLAQFGIGKSSSISYMLDVDGGSINTAAAQFAKQAYGVGSDGLIAKFINNSNEGYSSYIYIGSNPGTDWKIGKNISAPTTAVYNFEIVDSSNNLRMSIGAVSGNTTFNGNVTANALIKLGGTSSQYLMADGSVSTLSNPVTGTGTATYLPIWSTGTSLGNSLISQPDGSNVQINFADTYGMGGKFSYVSTFVSKLKLGRVGDAFSSNVDLIYDIAGAEVFEIRRNYSNATFKISLGATTHFSISNIGATTINTTTNNGITITTPDVATLKMTNSSGGTKNWGFATTNLSVSDFGIYQSTSGGGDPISAGSPILYFNGTGSATFSSSVTASNELSILAGDGAGKKLYFTGGTTKYNFMIAAQQNVDNALEITPSTAAGGSTFSTPALTIASTGAATFSSSIDATYATLSSTQPLVFTGGSNSGTFNRSTIYSAQNNTSGSTANGIFIERGRLTDSGSAEVRHFVIGARGGQIQWKCDGVGYTTQNGTSEVKPSGDGDYFVGRLSGGSAKCFVAYQLGADGYLELRTGANNTVTKLSGYTGTPNYTLARLGVGITGPLYQLDVDGGSITGAAFRATKQSSGADGLVAYFTNSSNGGYSSYIYIGSNPGTDWKIGKNVVNPSSAVYHFEIVDSSNNVRMRINNSTGAVDFSNTVTATAFFESSDSRIKELITDNYRTVGVESIKPKLYKKNGSIELGYFAQDVQEIMGHCVSINDDGFLTLSYREVHTAKIAYLEDSVEEMKAKILYLEKQLKEKK